MLLGYIMTLMINNIIKINSLVPLLKPYLLQRLGWPPFRCLAWLGFFLLPSLFVVAEVKATAVVIFCSYYYGDKVYDELYLVDHQLPLVQIRYPFAPTEAQRNFVETLIVDSSAENVIVARLPTDKNHYFNYKINTEQLIVQVTSVNATAAAQAMAIRTCKNVDTKTLPFPL